MLAGAGRARRPTSRPGTFRPTVDDEDVHTALERGLLERLGALGGKLRAGRSRNDQVATDLRLYLRDARRERSPARRRAADGADRLRPSGTATPPMPGMTHLQHAQPVLLAHHLLAARARARRATSTGCATGTGAPRSPARRRRAGRLVAAARPGGRRRRARLRPAPIANSIDAVVRPRLRRRVPVRRRAARRCTCRGSARRSACGRRAEFGWVELDDAYATGSSIMPQKKNPDIAELARGKAGRLIGNLTGLLATLKGLPLAYDRDLQEDKEPVFDAVEQLLLLLPGADRHGRDAARSTPTGWPPPPRRASRWPPTSPSGWSARASPFRDAHEISGPVRALLRGRAASTWPSSTDDELAASTTALTPDVRDGAHRRGRARGPRRPRRHGAGPGRRAARRARRDAASTAAAWASGGRWRQPVTGDR